MINAGNKKIVNVGTPTKDTDAANKKYVDDKFGGLQQTNWHHWHWKIAWTTTGTGSENELANQWQAFSVSSLELGVSTQRIYVKRNTSVLQYLRYNSQTASGFNLFDSEFWVFFDDTELNAGIANGVKSALVVGNVYDAINGVLNWTFKHLAIMQKGDGTNAYLYVSSANGTNQTITLANPSNVYYGWWAIHFIPNTSATFYHNFSQIGQITTNLPSGAPDNSTESASIYASYVVEQGGGGTGAPEITTRGEGGFAIEIS